MCITALEVSKDAHGVAESQTLLQQATRLATADALNAESLLKAQLRREFGLGIMVKNSAIEAHLDLLQLKQELLEMEKDYS